MNLDVRARSAFLALAVLFLAAALLMTVRMNQPVSGSDGQGSNAASNVD